MNQKIINSESQKGKNIKILGNNRYYFERNNSRGQLWRCSKRSCTSLLHIDKTDEFIKITEHRHQQEKDQKKSTSEVQKSNLVQNNIKKKS